MDAIGGCTLEACLMHRPLMLLLMPLLLDSDSTYAEKLRVVHGLFNSVDGARCQVVINAEPAAVWAAIIWLCSVLFGRW